MKNETAAALLFDILINVKWECEKEAILMATDELLENRWIPCSERLPSESGTYLTTTSKGSVCTDHFYAGSNDISGRHWSYHRRREPIAWRPLPKPYKEEEDNNGNG